MYIINIKTTRINLLFLNLISKLLLFWLTLIITSLALADSTINDRISNLSQNLTSIEITDNLKKISNIKGVIIVGSTCAGKTFLVNELKKNITNIVFPLRYITRPIRQNDDFQENKHLNNQEFSNFIHNGTIKFFWERKMDNNRIEFYGFHNNEMDNKLPIYSANNAILNSPVLKNNNDYLIIGVYAPENIRKARLFSRSPDLSTEEKKYRILDPYKDTLKNAHIIINNYDNNEKFAKEDIVALVNNILKVKQEWGIIENLNDYKIEYTTRLFDVVNHTVKFSDGTKKSFQFVRRSPGVRSLIIKDDKILITKEWRTELNDWDYRLPGGKVFENAEDYKKYISKKNNDSFLLQEATHAAVKELEEEANMTIMPSNLKHAYISKCGATVEWDLHYFVAVNPKVEILPKSLVETQEGERTIVQWLPVKQVLDLCLQGKVREDRTAAFLMRYILKNIKNGV